MHKNPSRTTFDDLLMASTRSTSRLAEIDLLEIFVLALSYIKDVRVMVLTTAVGLYAQVARNEVLCLLKRNTRERENFEFVAR